MLSDIETASVHSSFWHELATLRQPASGAVLPYELCPIWRATSIAQDTACPVRAATLGRPELPRLEKPSRSRRDASPRHSTDVNNRLGHSSPIGPWVGTGVVDVRLR